jgi:hypothetical protein
MLLTAQHICVSTGTGSKGKLVQLGPFQLARWSPEPPRSVGDIGGFNNTATTPSASIARDFPVACAKGMDRKKARITDDPGNSSQNATIHRTQGLRAAGEVRILARWNYFGRYSEEGRVLVVRTQSAFGLRSMWGNQKSDQRQEGGFGPRSLMSDFRSAGPSSLKDPWRAQADHFLRIQAVKPLTP